MAIFKLTRDYFENLSVTTHPRRQFSSASNESLIPAGMTGTVNVFAQNSKIEKESQKLRAFNDTASLFEDSSLETKREELVSSATNPEVTNIYSLLSEYLGSYDLDTGEKTSTTAINWTGPSARKKKAVEIIRFEPSLRYTSDTNRKNVTRNVLFPFYRGKYPSLHWSVTNYHSLNFFTGSNVPSDSVMIYPAMAITTETPKVIPYSPPSGFTFDFYINPRYTTDDISGEFRAGTIYHMSSSYAVSLVTGSSLGIDEKPDGFRIMLQLSSSAEISPSMIPLGIENNDRSSSDTYLGIDQFDPLTNEGTRTDLVFLSKDNSLYRNHWHHVAIRWGGPDINAGIGSFVIDGVEDATFLIPSASIIPQEFDNHVGHNESLDDPGALFIGNFYEGKNNLNIDTGQQHYIAGFFDDATSQKEGLRYGDNIGSGLDPLDPDAYYFTHPLNAEVHDLKIWSEYRTDDRIKDSMDFGISNISKDDPLLFYVPPFFVKETRERDVMVTPFQNIRSTTDDPFNVALSFGVGGHMLNLENFTREFVREEYPRLLNLSASIIDAQVQTPLEANEYLFATGTIRKRNLTVLPCDNGLFFPGFRLLSSGTTSTTPQSGSLLDKYTNDFGSLDFSQISLTNLLPQDALYPGLIQDESIDDSIMSEILGASPENPGVAPGSILTVFQRTRDSSSNEVVFFDASNLYYGNKIEPGTYEIFDASITGSAGKVSMKLRDDGHGALYRADCITQHASWSNIGNIIYEEGISVVKSPVIPYYGKEQFEVAMAGNQNIHVMEIHVPCEAGTINSSSNPQYQKLHASNFASENENEFVYITGLNFHDENLNVIARTNLARPILKRDSDKYVFRVKVDF